MRGKVILGLQRALQAWKLAKHSQKLRALLSKDLTEICEIKGYKEI